MATLADIQANLDQVKATAQRTEDAEVAAVGLLTSIVATNKDLSDKLDAALKSNDPAALEAINQELKDTNAALAEKTDALAAAIVANTPAAPAA